MDFHILLRCEQLRHPVDILPTNVSVVRDLHLALFTLLSGNKDNTVGTVGTIDGTRCSVLQDVDTLDVGRVKVVDITA